MRFSLSLASSADLTIPNAQERFLSDDEDAPEDTPKETVGRNDTGMAGEDAKDDETGVGDIKGEPQT